MATTLANATPRRSVTLLEALRGYSALDQFRQSGVDRLRTQGMNFKESGTVAYSQSGLRLTCVLRKQRSTEVDLTNVAPAPSNLTGNSAKFANDVTILRVKDMFVTTVRCSIRRQDLKNATTLIRALFDHSFTLPMLRRYQSDHPSG